MNAKKEWAPPAMQIFGDMQTLTLQDNGNGNGTGNTGSGQCSGKGCGTNDSLMNNNANNLTGFAASSL